MQLVQLVSYAFFVTSTLWEESRVKQGNLMHLLLATLIYKKEYPQVLKIFIHTPKHHHDPFHTKK